MPDYRLGRLNGEFVAKWEDEEGPHRWKLYETNPKRARAALKRFARQRELLATDAQELTMQAIWSDYITDRADEGKNTTRMEDAWKALAPHFALLKFPDLRDGRQVRDYTAKRRTQGISDGTIHTELLFFRAAINLAGRRHEIIPPRITAPPKPRPKDRWLTPSEANRLLDAARTPHMRLYILLALYTAGRPSSILDLTWDRVKDNKIMLDNPERDRTRKGRATVPLHDALKDPLHEAQEAALTDYVIEWAYKPVKSVKKGIARAAERAGFDDVTAYTLRHTAAVWMAQAGVPMEKIREYLGHESIETTIRIYARFHPEYLVDGADAIHEALKSA